MPKLYLLARLYDSRGVCCETLEGEAEGVARDAARFMVLQGTDPDEDGAAAQSGRVDFEPITAEEREFDDDGNPLTAAAGADPVTADSEPVDVVLAVLRPLMGESVAEAATDALFDALEAAGWSLGPNPHAGR